MRKLRAIVTMLIVFVPVVMILPFVCHMHPRMRMRLTQYCRVGPLYMVFKRGIRDHTVFYTNTAKVSKSSQINQKYNFQRELEVVKRERFERRKEELLYKLERRKARVFNKSIDINEPFPAVADGLAQVRRYYNVSKRKHTALDSEYLIESKTLCSEIPELIVLVPSCPQNQNIRTAIRSTYGLISRYTPSELNKFGMEHPVKVAFLLGKSDNKSIEANIKKEQTRFKDIVQVDFVDSYYNLTIKILYGLKWVSMYCSGVKYILKCDEDVFVNVRLLLAELHTYRVSPKGSVFGFIHSTYFGLKVLKTGKWGVKESEYPLQNYPPYAQGTSYTLTGNLAPKIVEIAQYLPYLHIEDAFITGIVAGKILGANLERILGNSYWTDTVPDPCEFVKTERVSQTNMVPSLMYKTWEALLYPDIVCANSSYRARAHRSTSYKT